MGGSSRPEIEAPENKILICRTCHTEITEHRWQLTRTSTELTVVSVFTGEVLVRRRYDPGFDVSAFFQRANLLEADLHALLPGIPYLTDDQLVELFQQLRSVDKGTWKLQAAILYEARQRSVYGDRAWEAMGRSFGIGWRQAYNLARVWQTFFTNDRGEFCNQLQNSALEESTWYVVASETQMPQYWLHYAEDQKAKDPSYSISDFKDEIKLAGAGIEQDPNGTRPAGKRCQWLRVYCEKLDQVVRPGQCPGCDIYPFIEEALR
jgi:hypothetical protein